MFAVRNTIDVKVLFIIHLKHCLRRGFRRGASDLCTYKKQNDSDICLKNQKSIFRIVQNDIATVEHKDRSSYKME